MNLISGMAIFAAFRRAGFAGFLFGFCSGVFGEAPPVQVYHAPEISGRLEGSVQQMLGENATLSGGGVITGDWLVPGTPAVRINGHPTFGGSIAGGGSATPSGWQITLNGNAQLGRVVTRTNPMPLPAVAVVAAPTGTQSIAITAPNQTVPNWSAVRNLTVQGSNASTMLPPGAYENVTINGSGAITLGIAGATVPSLYQIQNLTLNGKAALTVAGPVTLRVKSSFTANGDIGAALHPDWLTLEVKQGGATLNGGASFHGKIIAPAGTVTINGNSELTGCCISDRLVINGSGVLRVTGGSSGGNQRPWLPT